jgi:hypothetical protein
MSPRTRRMTLSDFLASEQAPSVKVGRRFNGGAFMCCHRLIFAETGIWIEELVPVFQKLDATLAVSGQRAVKELSPKLA